MPLVLNREETERLFSMEEAIETTRRAFLALSGSQATMPERLAISVPRHQGTHLTMPCYVEGSEEEIVSVKVATVYPQNPTRHGLDTTLAYLILQDSQTGKLLALMDAEHLTTMRTGAGCAIATDLLASKEATVVTLFGAGRQAAGMVAAMVAVRPVEKLFVISRSEDRQAAFCDMITNRYGVRCEVAPAAEAILQSDIVCTATSSVSPVLLGEWLTRRVHINSVGAFRADMAELDVDAVRQCNIAVDYLPAAQKGAGELIQAGVDWNEAHEIGDLIEQGPPESFTSRSTLFKSVGVAVQDSFAAAYIYRKAVEAGVGQQFDL